MGCDGDDGVTPPPEPPADPAHLEPPPGGSGFQLETDETEVAPGDEVQDCYFFRVSELLERASMPADAPLNLNRVQIAQREGSHHMNVYRVRTRHGLDPDNGPVVRGKNGAGECFKSPNWADWPLIANSQQDGQLDWTFPEGVANVLQPDEWLMVQTHYVNATSQSTPEGFGKVRVNFWHLPADKVVHEMGTVFATKQSIRVCQSNPTPIFHGTCQLNSPDPVKVIGANGHFHSRGTQFDIFSWDGVSISEPSAASKFYSSTSWDDPPMLTSPDLDLSIPSMGGIWYSCTYQWDQPEPSVGCSGLDQFDAEKYSTPEENLDCCYTFGPIVEKNEHCNAFIYYYPKQDDVNCF
ncbi:hypothetical protein [Chondromyces apiculatus]|uniref:Copper type II ascorbate-dependent monooxygenase C-terminal domain-containing protein n=1 Tax=Chondromyces apiculatus DSM 436 TaxID=1192034 RepID=A0A017TCN7_9BACT|nr:hypothetical protein [Chondromyces apiculatus]EYF06550.1 Hypothetical protein CAP_1680 [Chondromyces apiculatus DSM 436]